jgi:hypothetical protein
MPGSTISSRVGGASSKPHHLEMYQHVKILQDVLARNT